MEKDYLKIVLEGLASNNTGKSYKGYFIREYRKAEKEHYSYDEFFDGLASALETFKKEMERRMFDRMIELNRIISWKTNGMNGDSDAARTPTEEDLRIAKELSDERDGLTIDDFPVSLFTLTKGAYSGDIDSVELSKILNELLDAMNEIRPKQSKKVNEIQPLDFELNQSEVIFLFDILQNAGFIKQPKFQEGSYYRKLESYFTAKGAKIKDAEQKRNKFLEKSLSTSESIKEALLKALKNH